MKKYFSNKRTMQLVAALCIVLASYFLGERVMTGPEDAGTANDAPETGEVQIVGVVDGDTVDLSNGERVRLIGIDAPERGELYYAEARDALASSTLGKTVRIEQDVTERDRYGRRLYYIYADDLFINVEMVRAGYAKAYPYKPDTQYASLIQAAEDAARVAGAGVWKTKH